MKEKDINLAVARDLAARLAAAGAIPLLTRDGDYDVPLFQRPVVADAQGAALFLSIHNNALDRPNRWHGTESYWWTPQSQVLALLLHRSLVAGLGRRDNGVKQHRYGVLWPSSRPSALVELMYLDSDEERALLVQPRVQQRAADALLAGLRAYFGEVVP